MKGRTLKIVKEASKKEVKGDNVPVLKKKAKAVYRHGGKVGGHRMAPKAHKRARGGADGGNISEPDNKNGETHAQKFASGGWIKGAIKHPGSFTKQADRAGKSVHAFAEEHKHDSGKTGARARLALTLSKMRHKK